MQLDLGPEEFTHGCKWVLISFGSFSHLLSLSCFGHDDGPTGIDYHRLLCRRMAKQERLKRALLGQGSWLWVDQIH